MKDASRVPAKRVEVAVERGWRCGGMVYAVQRGRAALARIQEERRAAAATQRG